MATVPQPNDETDFARAWRWDEDGLHLEGTYLRLEEGPSEYGRRAIVVLDVDGTERALWLSQQALRSKFADELERRSAGDFTIGEAVVVERGAEKTKSQNDRAYWPFTVRFPDAPHRSAAEILGTDVGAGTSEPANEAAADDDLPF
jgi:hypothetical protein